MLIDIYMKFLEDILNRFQVTERTRFCDRQSSKGNNSKSIKQKLWFLHSARHLILIDIYLNFHEDRLNGFQVIERTRFCDKVQGKELKKYKYMSYGSSTLHVD